ncbi:hypothetical protein [uncultured Parasphingopyxis sp.]|uniref:hypothetical protein n=1 Tax=uncultured Parasphingopyxis sp. TaxID=1547918 RepID=UPI0026237C3E|nr:hypothetical protein [uncultured Parasphingopyxis sp.]
MIGLVIAALALDSGGTEHPCLGDFVHRADSFSVSIGLRVRQAPDYAEVLFSDFGSIQSPAVHWDSGSVTVTDQADGSEIVVVCGHSTATLVLPQSEYSPTRTYEMRRTQGSLWEVGLREGWLQPEH